MYKYTGHPPKAVFGNEEVNPSFYAFDSNQTRDFISCPNLLHQHDKIDLYMPFPGYVTFSVYDLSGRLVAQPARNRYYGKGRYSLCLTQGNSIEQGVYFLHFHGQCNEERISLTKKVIIIK
ncbi:MAG: hypothetical protein E3J78_02455 [Candidatus Cloacimonadota bacterium]|nr:MAG: hypothetical protein E3J78_02455 [Candidatus Cloacimonadota bacterium]